MDRRRATAGRTRHGPPNHLFPRARHRAGFFFPAGGTLADGVAFLSKLISSLLPSSRLAPVEFAPISADDRARVEQRLAAPAQVAAPARLVELLDRGHGAFAAEHERVLEEVKRRCKDADVWQSFFLDLLDEEGAPHEDGEGVGAEPVGPDEELRRLLAGVRLFPAVRPRYAWELGYHVLRHALATGDPALVKPAAAAAAEDFLLAYDAAKEAEPRVSALGDLAGALLLAGDEPLARLLCDYAAAAISAEEAVRQELHRLRNEGAAFVRQSYGVRSDA